jgi:hypothetical protein
MRENFGILNTDEVNRQNIRVPVEALAAGLEQSVRHSLAYDLPIGSPSHIGHDMHRPTGWCVTTAIMLASDMARQLGYVFEFDDKELSNSSGLFDKFWDAHHTDGTKAFEAELRTRVGQGGDGARAIRCEAAVLHKNGLASLLYPQFFNTDQPGVDKDGLIDFAELLRLCDEVQPGVFHDRTKNLLLFAHRYFRRRQSHRNSLNTYFLSRFSSKAKSDRGLRGRIRLDPDIVGHPDSLLHILEFEYWAGPKFKRDIAHIKVGVAEHKADNATRHFEGVDATQLWWKGSETRKEGGRTVQYRTFEAEELVENPALGIGEDRFACRYAHAEYREETKAISHFDGAIRAYEAEPYLLRLDKRIDRAGKHATYTKLFRFDGSLEVDSWQELTSHFFRGNPLLTEYFSADMPAKPSVSVPSAGAPTPNEISRLLATVSFSSGEPSAVSIVHRKTVQDSELFWVEEPSPALLKMLGTHIGPDTCFLSYGDGQVNFPVIRLADQVDADGMANMFTALSQAMDEDLAAGAIKSASFTFDWMRSGLKTRLAVAGDASLVVSFFRQLPLVLMHERQCSEWIGALADKVKECNLSEQFGLNTPQIILEDDGSFCLCHVGNPELKIPKEYASKYCTAP